MNVLELTTLLNYLWPSAAGGSPFCMSPVFCIFDSLVASCAGKEGLHLGMCVAASFLVPKTHCSVTTTILSLDMFFRCDTRKQHCIGHYAILTDVVFAFFFVQGRQDAKTRVSLPVFTSAQCTLMIDSRSHYTAFWQGWLKAGEPRVRV